MKQFKLKEEKSFVKILKEPATQKPKVNWNRRIYISLLILALFFIVRHLYRGNMLIHANGQVNLPKQTINFQNDIQVLQLSIAKGDSVCQGDTLFSYKIMADELQKTDLLIADDGSDWVIRERLRLQKKINLNNILLKNNKEREEYLMQMIRQKENMLLSGLHEAYEGYNQLQERLASLESDNEMLYEENRMLRRHFQTLRANTRSLADNNRLKLELYNAVKTFVSPVDGVISDIFHENNEICYKKSEMMTIHQMRNASISTYFDPEEIDHLSVGDVVDVNFPDGTNRKGLISSFYVSTYAVPEEFQKKYEPTERNIVAQVIPMNPSEEQNWRHFYKMNVKVEKHRFPFLKVWNDDFADQIKIKNASF